ncbi:hypothetical protein F5144DRAFT_202493 [Chaetomium tenue]|uniref:Uncharacterized protein n=1 Tax=Chaetomium tenue TaxID=1854479 RepID=A0ACB7PH50_9PEZI|nr:hypothetical protein F5144DRAFT_202493 [Chaetomium globosum]
MEAAHKGCGNGLTSRWVLTDLPTSPFSTTICSPQHTYHTQPQAAHLQEEASIIDIDPTHLSATTAAAAISRRVHNISTPSASYLGCSLKDHTATTQPTHTYVSHQPLLPTLRFVFPTRPVSSVRASRPRQFGTRQSNIHHPVAALQQTMLAAFFFLTFVLPDFFTAPNLPFPSFIHHIKPKTVDRSVNSSVGRRRGHSLPSNGEKAPGFLIRQPPARLPASRMHGGRRRQRSEHHHRIIGRGVNKDRVQSLRLTGLAWQGGSLGGFNGFDLVGGLHAQISVIGSAEGGSTWPWVKGKGMDGLGMGFFPLCF